MQVQRIGLVDGRAALEAAAPNREQRFKNRIEQHGQRIEWRNAGIAHHQLYRQLGQHEAQEIGSTVAQKDPAKGKVPNQETQSSGSQRGRKQETGNIMDL